MNARSGRRSWVKLWVNEWLDGTTRDEMSDSQRAFWIDLLALAGRSRFPGKIFAGESGGSPVGYSLNKFQALMSEPIDIEETLALFERTGKIRLTVTSENPKRVMIELLSWDKYQSEYHRQRKYREQVQPKLQPKLQPKTRLSDKTEVEGEVEEKKKKEKPTPCASAQLSVVPIPVWNAFVEHRKRLRAPLTPHAGDLIQRKLEQFKLQGHDPVAILEQSIERGWKGVFEVDRSGLNGKPKEENYYEAARQLEAKLGLR